MTFYELVNQVIAVLQREGRVSYRALKREFTLDDDYLADLKAELIDAKRLAVDEDGKVLVWNGASPVSGSKFQVSSSQPPDPGLWTPAHLAERIRAEQAAMEARGVTDGERKTITALFADIKGSMALMEDLDPEEARAIVDPALVLMMDAVHRYEGYVVQSTGDGIFAFFGAPIAHEDHPQRALYAALRMQEEIGKYADALRLAGRTPVEIRVGINTGEVVLRSIRKDDLRTDYTPIGHSTGLAARMEGLAKVGSIVVSEHTEKLTEGYFAFKALGAAKVKGVSEPVQIYEVLGTGPLRTRLQVAARRGLVRFVGRQHELEHLRRALEQARSEHGQIMGVMGEPGVGKSRLFFEFKLLSQRGCLILEIFSVSHGKAYPYLPLIDLLKNYFQITTQDDERTRREKVGGKVLMLDRSLEDTLPHLFTLLGIAEPTSSLQQMDPQIRKQRTFEAIKRLLVRESLNQPLVLIFEDLHWLDHETQTFLTLFAESIASAKIVLLTNYRPEYTHAWSTKTYFSQLRLDPLRQEDAQELGHPSSVVFALSFVATLHQYRREGKATQERAETLIALSREQGFPQWVAGGTIRRGWALAEQGQKEEGIEQIRQGVAAWRAIGAEIGRPKDLALLAETYGKVGQTEEGLRALEEALEIVSKTEEHWYEAELYRLKGELTLQKFQVASSKLQVADPQSLTSDTQAEAEACFHRAIDIARRQQAKSLELRAVMSLARLWQQQGKTDEARRRLAEVYGWFTEGFDTADLKDAKALLEELT